MIPFPDLRTSAAIASAITTDTAFNLNWTALNEGAAATGANWTEKIYFSTDNQIGNDLFLGEQQITNALAPNQTVNLQQSVTVPWSAVPTDGNYFIIIQTDANANLQETEEVDNWRVVPVTVQRSLRPDLTVDSITVSPKANAGDTVRVDFRVKNRGNGATGVAAWTDSVLPVERQRAELNRPGENPRSAHRSDKSERHLRRLRRRADSRQHRARFV